MIKNKIKPKQVKNVLVLMQNADKIVHFLKMFYYTIITYCICCSLYTLTVLFILLI